MSRSVQPASSADHRLYIVDSVSAARALLADGVPAADCEILSTHCSVPEFLHSRGIVARDFSDFIDSAEARAVLLAASRELDTVLGQLDDEVAARMCAAAGLPAMRLFHAAFKYRGQYHLTGIKILRSVLDSRLAAGKFRSVVFYRALSSSHDRVFSLCEAAAEVCLARTVQFEQIQCEGFAGPRFVSVGRTLYAHLWHAMQAPDIFIASLLRRFRPRRDERQPDSASSPAVLLLDPGADSFFERLLAGRGVQLVPVPADGIVSTGVAAAAAKLLVEKMKSAAAEWLQTRPVQSHAARNDLFVSLLVERASALLLPVACAHLFRQARPVSAVAWDAPVVTRAPLNLVVELMLAEGVPVLGRQHGANYVDQDLGTIHFDSDFNRCTEYFSYGFGQSEFAATYPRSTARCKFVPAGHPPLAVGRWQRRVDIAFPIMSCGSLFNFSRMPEAAMARRQSLILAAMEARSDLSCVVKPLLNFSEDDFAHTQTLRRLRHVRLARTTWTRFLARWRPRLVLLEIASTSLYQTLPLDIDIFLMLDPVFPFNEQALALLRRRVHVFSTVEEMTDAIRHYGSKPAPRLRDSTFHDTFVNRGSAAQLPELFGAQAAAVQRRFSVSQ